MSDLEDRIRALPKVELHQHVDGSIPVDVTWELMRHYRLNPTESKDELRRRLELQPEEEGTLLAYLDKMHYPLWITQFYENISQVTEAIVDGAAAAGVRTLELRYSPVIHTFAGLTPRQSIRAVLSGMNRARRRHEMKLGLVVIAMRQHGPHIAKILARQAIAEAQHLHARTGVVGFDIAGPERGNPPRLFKSAYEIARAGAAGRDRPRGRGRARRLRLAGGGRAGGHAHRARLLRGAGPGAAAPPGPGPHPDGVLRLSNYHTGAVRPGERHPIHAFLEAGVPVAVCSDNTTVSRTDQVRESARVAEVIGFEAVERIHRAAEEFSFIRPETALASADDD